MAMYRGIRKDIDLDKLENKILLILRERIALEPYDESPYKIFRYFERNKKELMKKIKEQFAKRFPLVRCVPDVVELDEIMMKIQTVVIKIQEYHRISVATEKEGCIKELKTPRERVNSREE